LNTYQNDKQPPKKAYNFGKSLKGKLKDYIILSVIAHAENAVTLYACKNKGFQKDHCLMDSQPEFMDGDTQLKPSDLLAHN